MSVRTCLALTSNLSQDMVVSRSQAKCFFPKENQPACHYVNSRLQIGT